MLKPQGAEAPPQTNVAEVPSEEPLVEKILEHVSHFETPPVAPAHHSLPAERTARSTEPPPGLRLARVVSVKGATAHIAWRGGYDSVEAKLDVGVDPALLEQAIANHDGVLVETDADGKPVIVGVVQRRLPTTVVLKASRIAIEAGEEILLRAGRAAVRLREDGEVEVVGSRISTVSRGLFRIVGRILRLN